MPRLIGSRKNGWQLCDGSLAVRRPADVGLGYQVRTSAIARPTGRAGGELCRRRPQQATVKAARRLNRSAATLATSVLLDSAVEHYRGSFKNKAMFTPLIVSALTLAVSAHGTADKRPAAHDVRDLTYLLAALTGLAGTGFHVYNVTKRPGAMSWQNLFYGAPLGAPMAILLSGLLGFYSRTGARHVGVTLGAGVRLAGGTRAGGADRRRVARHHRRGGFAALQGRLPRPLHVPAGHGAAGRQRHWRAKRRWARSGRDRWFSRAWLRLTALLGFAGVGFHAWGVQPQHGRLAELAAERAERPAAARAPQLHRPRIGGLGRTWPDGGSSRCLTTTGWALSRLRCAGEAEHAVVERRRRGG